MNRAVQSLKGKLPANVSIHVDATVFEAEGPQAVAKKQASLLAAPVDGPDRPAAHDAHRRRGPGGDPGGAADRRARAAHRSLRERTSFARRRPTRVSGSRD